MLAEAAQVSLNWNSLAVSSVAGGLLAPTMGTIGAKGGMAIMKQMGLGSVAGGLQSVVTDLVSGKGADPGRALAMFLSGGAGPVVAGPLVRSAYPKLAQSE